MNTGSADNSFFMGDSCLNCGGELCPEENYFIQEVQDDLMWYCVCGYRYDVDHDCKPDFCTEVLKPVGF